MRNILIALVVIVVLGAGYYYYENTTPTPAEHTQTEQEMQMQENTQTSGNTIPSTVKTEDTGTSSATAGGEEAPAVTPSKPTESAKPSVKEFTVTGSSFAFAPKTMTVKKGDTVKITFKNSGGMHDLVIDEFNARTKQIQGGQQEVLTFVADKAGSFEYYCSVGQHRQMGMKGTLTVTE